MNNALSVYGGNEEEKIVRNEVMMQRHHSSTEALYVSEALIEKRGVNFLSP